MGISFYAFTGIAYMVDVYRRVIEPEINPVRFALFTSFFPHLVAGPILRPAEFLDPPAARARCRPSRSTRPRAHS